MNQDISLWTPVIISSLRAPHTLQEERHITVGPFYKRIEDIKVRVRKAHSEQLGKSLETVINLEIVILMEEMDGRTVLISRPETIKERLSFHEFDRPPQRDEEKVGYITEIQGLSWDGDQQNNEIIINYTLKYMVFAVREQMVRLYSENEYKNPEMEYTHEFQVPPPEISWMERSNEDLKHKLFLYEKDVLGLQRAIKKTEERNAMLNRELNGTKQLVQSLRDAITRKDLLICRYENQGKPAGGKSLPGMSGIEPKLGQRLKRMFMSNL